MKRNSPWHQRQISESLQWIQRVVYSCAFAKGHPCLCYAVQTPPKHLIWAYLGQIFTKSFRSFINMFIILIISFLSFQNILFLEGTGAILRKSPKPLKTSNCVYIGQYCTKPLTSFCVVFIKTFWTFLSLQNICFQKGTAFLNLMRDLLLLLPRNIIETAPLIGTKGSMISQLLH